MRRLEYHQIRIIQTVVQRPESIREIEPVQEGHGEGLFVVISACNLKKSEK